jgi:hypothetical protein
MKKLMTLMIALFVAAGVWADPPAVVDFDGKQVEFTWNQAFGTLTGAVNVNNAPYNTDGGFFLLKLYDAEDNLLKFDEVFEELSISSQTYHDGSSKRLLADFTGAQHEGIWGTRVLSDNADNGYTLRDTDLNGALLYGIMFDQEGNLWAPPKDPQPVGNVSLTWVAYVFPHGFGKDDLATITLPVTYKRNEGAGGGYRLVIEFHEEFRGETVGTPTATYDNFEAFQSRVAVASQTYMLNVYNEDQNVYYENIMDALAADEPDAGDIISIPSGTYSGTVTDNVGVTFSPGASPGCVTISGNFTVTPTTTFDMDIWGETVCTQYDQIEVTGDLDITDADLNIILDGYIPTLGDQFTIFIYGGTLSGTFDNITVDNPDVEFTISYGVGTDDEIVLTTSSVPPPIPLANWALYLGFILMALFVAIRFRGRVL